MTNKATKLGTDPGSATDLARLAAGLAGPTRTLIVSESPIRLNLPDVSRTIETHLPRPLQELDPGETLEDATGERTAKRSMNAPGSAPPATGITSPSDLGSLVRQARERKHLSQQSFADLAGVGRRFVSELENGKATLEFGKVLKVARAAGISMFARDH